MGNRKTDQPVGRDPTQGGTKTSEPPTKSIQTAFRPLPGDLFARSRDDLIPLVDKASHGFGLFKRETEESRPSPDKSTTLRVPCYSRCFPPTLVTWNLKFRENAELMKVKNVTGSILQRMERFEPQELEEMRGFNPWDAVMILDTPRIMQQDRAQDAAAPPTVAQTRLPKRLRPLTAEEVVNSLPCKFLKCPCRQGGSPSQDPPNLRFHVSWGDPFSRPGLWGFGNEPVLGIPLKEAIGDGFLRASNSHSRQNQQV